jgi:hypothetical protein
MSLPRFLAAASAGALFCFWAVFLVAAIAGGGGILWDGRAHDGFSPGYFALLYGTPLMAAVMSFLALRRSERDA